MIRKLLLFILSIQILNMSIGCIEFEPLISSQANTSPGNDIDSFLEYISENVMGYDNSFPEIHDSQQQKSSSHQQKGISFKLFQIKETEADFRLIVQSQKFMMPANDSRIIDYSAEINPPPPKA